MAEKAEIILFGSYDFCPHGMGRSPNFCNLAFPVGADFQFGDFCVTNPCDKKGSGEGVF